MYEAILPVLAGLSTGGAYLAWHFLRPKYKIIHNEKLGYLPVYIDDRIPTALSPNGVERFTLSDTWFEPGYEWLWVPTSEEAGRGINLHAERHSYRVVWKG